MTTLQFLVGVDGGGSGTRVRLQRCGGPERAMGQGGPSALALGVDAAWSAIDTALTQAFAQSGLQRPPDHALAVGIGIAGSNVPSWAGAFTAAAPAFGALCVDSDAYTTLLGAHSGAPGAIVAVGTGIGLALVSKGVERLGGRVGVESEPGRGCRFWIELQQPAGAAESSLQPVNA